MDQFVHAQNLIRYIDLLEHEADPVRREHLHGLLLEEENRFGNEREKLIEADGLIAGARVRVGRQRQLIAQLDEAGGSRSVAEALLVTMERTLALLLQYRRMLDVRSG